MYLKNVDNACRLTGYLNNKWRSVTYEGCPKNNVTCAVFRGKREQYLLNCNISKARAYKYTEHRCVGCTLHFI